VYSNTNVRNLELVFRILVTLSTDLVLESSTTTVGKVEVDERNVSEEIGT